MALVIGKCGSRSSNAVVQSNVIIKQTDESTSNVAVTNNKKEEIKVPLAREMILKSVYILDVEDYTLLNNTIENIYFAMQRMEN